jgi:hypothetical protein
VALGLGKARVAVADGVSMWPAALLAGLGTPWNTLQLDGELGLSTQGLSVEWSAGRLAVGGRAELAAARISSRLSTLRPMGSYRITLNGGATSTLELATLEGSLQLSGNGRWVGSRLRFEGVASAAPEREAALSNLLNIIGRRNGARSIITIGYPMKFRFAIVYLAACAALATLPAVHAQRPGEPITLNFAGAEIEAVARTMGVITGRNIVVDPRVKGTMNLNTEKPVTPAAAYNQFLATLRLSGYTVVEPAASTRWCPRPTPSCKAARCRPARWAPAAARSSRRSSA